MNLYEFTVHLDRPINDDDFDTLYEAGLDDCLPQGGTDDTGAVMVARRSPSLTDAIMTVVADIERAGFEATSIEAEDLVTIDDIAAKTGRTRESVRLLTQGKRGPGGFPAPISPKGHAFYSWAAVREWFRTHYGDDAVEPADTDADTLAAADLLLRARLLTPHISQLRDLIPA